MKQMTQMIYYEIKKIFSQHSAKLALLLLCVTLGVTTFLTVHSVSWIDEQGEKTAGPSAAQKLRAARKEWAGYVDEDVIRRVIEENARVNATPEAQSSNVVQQEIAFSKKQGFYDIRMMIARSFSGFRELDYYLPDSLTPEDASRFYPNRMAQLTEWLDGEAKDTFSESEREWIIQKYQELPTPLWYDYAEGWLNLQTYSATIIMISLLILVFPIAGIFSGEAAQKADAIFFSTYHGRRRAVLAKLCAGFLVITGTYWTMMLIYTAVTLGLLGTDGADCLIAVFRWKTLYELTNGQAYALIVLGGYLGCLFMLLLAMLVSAKTKSTAFAVTIPFFLMFAPGFLSGSHNAMLTKLIGLLPDQLLQMNTVFSLFSLYRVGTHICRSAPLLFAIYPAACILLLPLIYRVFRRTQVA